MRLAELVLNNELCTRCMHLMCSMLTDNKQWSSDSNFQSFLNKNSWNHSQIRPGMGGGGILSSFCLLSNLSTVSLLLVCFIILFISGSGIVLSWTCTCLLCLLLYPQYLVLTVLIGKSEWIKLRLFLDPRSYLFFSGCLSPLLQPWVPFWLCCMFLSWFKTCWVGEKIYKTWLFLFI